MKAIFAAVLALAATALAGPIIAERQVETQADAIDALIEKIQGHTANINATTAAAPANPNLLEQNAAAAQMAPDFAGITQALTQATTILSKRDFWVEVRTDGKDKPGKGDKGKCDNDCLLIKVKKLVFEISCTLRFVIIKLGLGCVLVYLTPLIIALSGLLKCLDKVVAGLLFAVKGILDGLLGGLAAGLLGLIIW